MPVFYTLHNLFNDLRVNTDEKGNVEHGKRNCKLFLLGTFIWVVIFVLVWNMKMGYFGPTKLWMDSLVYGLIIVFLADLFVMAYTYKSYFGRSVMWETTEDDSEVFDYDESKHKYKRKTKARGLSENDKVFLGTVNSSSAEIMKPVAEPVTEPAKVTEKKVEEPIKTESLPQTE